MAALIEAQKVTKVFGGGVFGRGKVNIALEDFSFVVNKEPPAITAIVGESGSGKTTLARLLLGVAAPTEGAVLYQGKSVHLLNRAERRQFLRDVQVIFQDPYEVYNPFYRVDHVLETPISKLGLASSQPEARRLMVQALQEVGLRPEETLGRFPHQLSGGQRQRIMVARALLLRPSLIIADEPVSMVDASLRATILESLRQLNQQFGISLIYITHDLTTAYQISDNIIVLYRGQVAEAGDIELVVKQPKHPYTHLLTSSVPIPDPNRSWRRERTTGDVGSFDANTIGASSRQGCVFADRCPQVMDICHTARPPLYRVDEHQAAACYLYRDSPVLPSTELGSVLPVSAVAGYPPRVITATA